MTDYADLHGLVKALAEHESCAICHQNDWITSAESVLLPVSEGDSVDTKGRLAALAFVCRRCGYIRLFSITQLQAIGAELRGEASEGNGHF